MKNVQKLKNCKNTEVDGIHIKDGKTKMEKNMLFTRMYKI